LPKPRGQASKYSIGATPTARLKGSKNAERESAASFANCATFHALVGSEMQVALRPLRRPNARPCVPGETGETGAYDGKAERPREDSAYLPNPNGSGMAKRALADQTARSPCEAGANSRVSAFKLRRCCPEGLPWPQFSWSDCGKELADAEVEELVNATPPCPQRAHPVRRRPR
jgi:hypothetical protein